MGGLASYNLVGGSVHVLFCVKVNESTQGVGAAGVFSHTHSTEY